MNKMTIVLMALLVAVLFVSGCADKDTGGGVDVDDIKPPAEPVVERDVLSEEVSEDIDEVESVSTELEDEDDENLDEEFENIDW